MGLEHPSGSFADAGKLPGSPAEVLFVHAKSKDPLKQMRLEWGTRPPAYGVRDP